jgi:hypothetical protein
VKIPVLNPTGVLAPLVEWVRAVQQVLSNGWTVRDQAAGEVKTVRWNEASAPLVISTTLTTKPLAIFLMTAGPVPADGTVFSGSSVKWQWLGDGQRSVSILDLELSAGDWDVTLWLVGG